MQTTDEFSAERRKATQRRGDRIPIGAWPRLLSQARAADYCDVSPNFLRTYCEVPPIRLGERLLWDRLRLDDWIDRLQETGDTLESDPFEEALNNAYHSRQEREESSPPR